MAGALMARLRWNSRKAVSRALLPLQLLRGCCPAWATLLGACPFWAGALPCVVGSLHRGAWQDELARSDLGHAWSVLALTE